MTTVWINDAENAAEGDYVLRPQGDTVEIARVDGGELCVLQQVAASTLPDIETADQERLLMAIRGVETALNTRGG